MGLEIYAGTIWAALAFKLQSSGEMGNDNCIKIKRISNWPSQWELAQSLSCCTAGSPAATRMWERAVPTHRVHQAVSDVIRVDNDNRKMKRWREKSARVRTFKLPDKLVWDLLWGDISFTTPLAVSFKVNSIAAEEARSPGDVAISVRLLCVPEVSKLPAIWEGR